MMFDRLRAYSPRQQIALAASAAAACCVLLALIWFFLLRVTYQPLFTNLKASDAATIVAELDRRKVSYRLEDGGATILVPADLVDGTRLAVMTGDLPLKGTVGFELFNKSDVGLTDFAQKINYQRALQGELERTIMTLDGIESARVHLSLGEDRIFRDDRVPPKASVTIRMQKGAHLSVAAAQGVQRLIGASVPNLDAGDVVILDESGVVIGAPAHVDAVPGSGSPATQEKDAIEQYYQARVRQALDRAYPQLGIDASIIAVQSTTDAAAGLPDWNPTARSFPLLVTLSTSAPLDASSQTGIRATVGSAIGSTATTSDTIQFAIASGVAPRAAPPAPAGASPPRMQDVVLPPPEEDIRGEWLAAAAVFALLVIVFIGLYALVFRARRPARLNQVQLDQFSTRLRGALVQGGARDGGL